MVEKSNLIVDMLTQSRIIPRLELSHHKMSTSLTSEVNSNEE